MNRFGRRTALDAAYCFAELAIAVVRFAVLMTLLGLAALLMVVVAGVPILVFAMYVARGFARVERSMLRRVLGRPVREPSYRSGEARRGLRQLLTPLTDPQSWLDLLHGTLGLLPAVLLCFPALVWWATAVGYSLYVVWGWLIPGNQTFPAELLWKVGPWPHTFLFAAAVSTPTGLLLLVSAPFVTRGAALATSTFARALLAPERVAELEERVEELTGSRDAAVAAEASALRRLERDIHDGPQQRLVRLGMDLGLARRRLHTDPDGTAALLADAMGQARETLDELRALSRGIAPPILADRGLAAALTALAGRSTVPVELEVASLDGVRLPAVAESAAYFVVAEALTNVAKHSGASRCRVQVATDAGQVRVSITDDGRGGAHPAKGHGLAGLADRVRAAGGRFDLESPPGGPTTLVANVPCA